MSYKFKYHPDGWICRNDGATVVSVATFQQAHPAFPLVLGEFFEYQQDGTFELLVNVKGTYSHFAPENPSNYQELIDAINNLE